VALPKMKDMQLTCNKWYAVIVLQCWHIISLNLQVTSRCFVTLLGGINSVHPFSLLGQGTGIYSQFKV
jgi:hypothetical protein